MSLVRYGCSKDDLKMLCLLGNSSSPGIICSFYLFMNFIWKIYIFPFSLLSIVSEYWSFVYSLWFIYKFSLEL